MADDAPTSGRRMVGPGVPVPLDGPPVTGVGMWPPSQVFLRAAAKWLTMLDGAHLANWQNGGADPEGAVFVTGDLATELGRIATEMDNAEDAIRRARAAADEDMPRWRKWWRRTQPGFRLATRAYRATEWFGEKYRDRYGDDSGYDD